MKILTEEQSALNALVSNHFAISRYYAGQLIHLNTGVYFEYGKAVASIAFMSPDSHENDIKIAFGTLELLTRTQADKLKTIIPRWITFEYIMDGREGEKIKMLDVIKQYCEHEPVTPKQFYPYFNAWIAENQIKANFKNRFGNRKLIFVR